MFIFSFLIIFLRVISFVKMHYMNQDTNFRNKDDSLFFPIFPKNEQKSKYDVRHWIQQQHLQHCVFVEIGEQFCALFVELETISRNQKPQIDEFFLGICDCETLRSWELCSAELFNIRRSDCIFTEAIPTANTSARVHRRLCDITLLSSFAPFCNCSIPLAGQELLRTEGSRFPTCFLDPLPESICSPRGVCGVSRCTVNTIMGIYSPKCDPDCHQKQPFCEDLGPWTSASPRITSFWSKWSIPRCNVTCGRGFLVSTAICYNQVTGKEDIDCIGPGFFCCSDISEECECEVTIENEIMKASRFTKPCTSSESCPFVTKQLISHPENQFEESENGGFNNGYGEVSQENDEGNFYYGMNNYEKLDKDDDDDDEDEELETNEKDKRMIAIDDEDEDEDIEYDPDVGDPDEELEEDEEEEDGDEDGEDDTMVFRKSRGRKKCSKYERVPRFDDEDTSSIESKSLDPTYDRQKLALKDYDSEDPPATDSPIYREYDSENKGCLNGFSIKSQISLLSLIHFIASFTISFG